MPEQLNTRDSAQDNANRIITYWERRGYDVQAKVLPLTVRNDDDVVVQIGWSVVTDMVNGWPKGLFEHRNAGRV